MSGVLSGRVALVTGGARGIGRGIALALAEAGADVAIADAHPAPFAGEQYYRLRRRVSGAEEETPTADAVRALGRRAHTVQLDVADAEAVVRGAADVAAALGPVDVLVNNAGIVNNIARIADMKPEAWEHELRVNLTGAFHTVRCFGRGSGAARSRVRGGGRDDASSPGPRAAVRAGPAQPALADGPVHVRAQAAESAGVPGGVPG